MTEAVSAQLPDVMAALDLLLRWAVLRLCETAPNTSSLLRVLDWLIDLLQALKARERPPRERTTRSHHQAPLTFGTPFLTQILPLDILEVPCGGSSETVSR